MTDARVEEAVIAVDDGERLAGTLYVSVEYVLYPGESHADAANGRPDRRIDRMRRVLDRFDRHLVPGSEPDTTS